MNLHSLVTTVIAACWFFCQSALVDAAGSKEPVATSASASSTASSTTADNIPDDHPLLLEAAVAWLQSQQGITLHSSLNITLQGIFATHDLPAQTALLTVEPQHVIGASSSSSSSSSTSSATTPTARMCQTASELQSLQRSNNNPLLTYWNKILAPTLPHQWSSEAIETLHTILGEQLEPQEFPANAMNCQKYLNSQDQSQQNSRITELTHSLTQALLFPDEQIPFIIPGWDLFRQQNGQGRFNVDFFPEYPRRPPSSQSKTTANTLPSLYVWKTTRPITAGEELTVSITDCRSCTDDDKWSYTTVEAFGDTGKVPNYPQRWELSLSTVDTNDIPAECEILDDETIVWWDNTHTDDYRPYHKGFHMSISTRAIWWGHIQRLRSMNITDLTDDLPIVESTAIREYISAYQRALELAFVSSSGEYDSPEERAYWKQFLQGHTDAVFPMNITERSYDSLEYRTTDTLEPCLENCNLGSFAATYNDHTDVLEDSESFYQPIRFRYTTHPTTGDPDTCIFLASVLQSCHSHRPNYHEPFAHYPAQYLDRDVKRILVLGGGDNMMAEEMLKYNDTLEFAIFMELDQKVVRESFRNYGVQPHFDHPKIQWWFGDAAKSMLMMPEEWIGTFDLVLVDLLTFVVDITKVTPTTTIMEYAMTMLRPGGIIIRNEDFEKIKKPDFASNTRNFLKTRPINQTRNMFLDLSIHNASLWRNYHFHPHINETVTQMTEPVVAAGNLGGLVICMEAENISGDLTDPAQLLEKIHGAFVTSGFTTDPLDNSQSWVFSHEADKSTSLFLTLSKGGYVSARCYPEMKYCGFDIALFNNFGKQYEAVDNLLKSIGGDQEAGLSTFRVVTGASLSAPGESLAFNKNSGDSVADEECSDNAKDEDSKLESTSNSTKKTNFAEILEIIASQMTSSKESKAVMGVLCGPPSNGDCHSKGMYKIDPSNEMIPIFGCKNLPLGDYNDASLLFACEQELRTTLHEIMEEHGKLGGFLVDPTATQSLGKVLHKILSNTQFRMQVMEEEFLLMGPRVSGSRSVDWLPAFLQVLRMEIVQIDPAYHVDLVVETPMGSFEVVLFSSAEAAYDKVVKAIETIESNTGQSVYIKKGTSGVTGYDLAYEPSKTFLHSDYDLVDPLIQWTEQKPLYQQNIFQFAISDPLAPLELGEDILFNDYVHFWFGTWSKGQIMMVHEDGTYDVNIGGRQRRNQKRSVLRKVETKMHVLQVGDKILADTQDDEGSDAWLPGSIIERLDDGRYLAQVFDKMGEDEVFEREKLMPFFEPPFSSKSDHKLTFSELHEIFSVIVNLFASLDQAAVRVHRFEGESVALTAVWETGSIVCSWNGSDRIDLNVKAAHASSGFKRVPVLMEERIANIALMSVDDFPRGTGRVLNNPTELKSFWFGEWNDRVEA